MLPDKLQHQQLVEIGIEQGARNRVQLPVMVMRAPRQIDDHDEITLIQIKTIHDSPVEAPGFSPVKAHRAIKGFSPGQRYRKVRKHT